MNPKQKLNIKALKKAILSLHGSKAIWVESVPVMEVFEGEVVWEGTVSIFELKGHPKATKCYAWSSPIEESQKRRYYAVLHVPPVDSPEKAVRASIVQDHKTGRII
jgi:hypothetical protein